MRNLLFLLLLANVLFFLHEQFVATPDETGIAIVNESDLGPTLQLADADEPAAAGESGPRTGGGTAAASSAGRATDTQTDAESNTESGAGNGEDDAPVMAELRPVELEATVGRSCVSLGPFRDRADAEAAQTDQQAQGFRTRLRATQGDVFIGHWVQILDLPDRRTANDMLETLQEGGLGEAYIVQTEEDGIKISLGLFGDVSGAERTELQAESLGLPAVITERTRAATVFYVDLALPPGRGAGGMIERYGEHRVQLREQATCPRGS